jgi:hypothetical protein
MRVAVGPLTDGRAEVTAEARQFDYETVAGGRVGN